MSPRLPHPLRSARHAAALIATTSAGTERLGAELDRVAAQLDDIVGRLSQVDQRLAETESRITQQEATDAARVSELRVVMEDHRHEVLEILQLLRDDESWTRRLLWQARETPEYALAFEEEEPLISVAITTYTNTEGLIERSLPSILAQTYERLDIVVVGDAAAPEVEKAVMAIGDARVRYANLTHRGPYPDDFEHLWMVAGGPPCNEAARLSRGRWIVHADDDDSSTPDRVEVLLRGARERQLEFCYGRIRKHYPDGTYDLLCEFPPREQAVSLTCAIMHSGLRFMASELGDALFHTVGDWARVRLMMRVGVRIGMIEDVVLEYYPSQLWSRQGIKPPR